MPSTIDLRTEDLRRVQEILHTHVPRHEVRAFGSRVLGTAKPASDLDLCIMGDERIAEPLLERLSSAFSESSLPFKVDIVVWADLQTGFRNIITATAVTVQQLQRAYGRETGS